MGQPVKPLRNPAEYSRGYEHSKVGRWPLHKPPFPPEPVIAELMAALRALRDAIDGEVAKFEQDDPINQALSPFITRADKAQEAVSLWLLNLPNPSDAAGDKE